MVTKTRLSTKGEVIALVHIPGILATRVTSSLIPLCHPILGSPVEVDFQFGTKEGSSPRESDLAIEVRVHRLRSVRLDMT